MLIPIYRRVKFSPLGFAVRCVSSDCLQVACPENKHINIEFVSMLGLELIWDKPKLGMSQPSSEQISRDNPLVSETRAFWNRGLLSEVHFLEILDI